MSHQTVFGDLRTRALAVYRVHTRSSVYLIGIHERDGRRFVIVRGEPGTDRAHVVVRDGDPRIGDRSLFEVPISEWVGRELEVATMTSSTIVAVAPETDAAAIEAVGDVDQAPPYEARSPWARPDPDGVRSPEPTDPSAMRPPGLPAQPRIIPNRAKGTHPALQNADTRAATQPLVAPVTPPRPIAVPDPVAPTPVDTPPYPERHILYAENVAALLRSMARRDRLFHDIDAGQKQRLRKALDEAVVLLEQIRRRDRK